MEIEKPNESTNLERGTEITNHDATTLQSSNVGSNISLGYYELINDLFLKSYKQ